jgi:hypothetical protein
MRGRWEGGTGAERGVGTVKGGGRGGSIFVELSIRGRDQSRGSPTGEGMPGLHLHLLIIVNQPQGRCQRTKRGAFN